MPSGSPEFRGAVKYMNADIEYQRRREKCAQYKKELKHCTNLNYIRFLKKKLHNLSKLGVV